MMQTSSPSYRIVGTYTSGESFFTSPRIQTLPKAREELETNRALRAAGTWMPVEHEHIEKVEWEHGDKGMIEITKILEVYQ